ncbi:MAG: helix-turn-helix domain-containing protein [Leptospiraceae bacterium]|nr:type II toxin-antitoxin system MqsA family antitoxin [Leptospiraceae bacterium]MCK6381749.1 helix-turn-helix domain-containing protein [Leptospiraceae bacterium]NUM42748.1 type II toxin-antitoxin system MqsA family antitoxin [Leptospiraceae bacterium]
MKEKKWIDCPSCGAKGSMVFKSNLSENYYIKDYGNLKIIRLEGHFCKTCKNGIYNFKSQNMINSMVAEFKAKKNANSVVAADLVSVDQMAKKLKITRQSIHKMMNKGKIKYVFVGDIRLPLKNQDLVRREEVHRA